MGGKTLTEDTIFGRLTPSPAAAALLPRAPGVNRARWSGCQATVCANQTRGTGGEPSVCYSSLLSADLKERLAYW